ncbi:flagellar assembly peptidoglycan hydrolase FlgJ [Halovibrio salipaludis]|uniref:Peptidoglycan hydrolase FlgJ n=1 Tax=Halovibrio salipaludis TaxID=2032626 RepID=A0A2A2F5Z6_9GAMM|nr:flagellar assembly peptidoglycan hydrolase FlgJ [Halovibrio salipaludis]PAU80358.1 flagellar assembly peptidoglycan hydrolase FlgJ [Halovibrio salipaludis]
MIQSSAGGTSDAHVYTDMSAMSDLKRLADTDRDKALEKVAKQFESLFLQQMMKSMRSANEVFSEGNYLNSQETEQYQDMFDKQLTLSLTRERSIGIADQLVRQLGGGEQGADRPDARTSITEYSRDLPAPDPKLAERVDEVRQMMPEEGNAGSGSADGGGKELPEQFNGPEQFVQELSPIARDVSEKTGVPAQVMIAQAALETGWGRNMIGGEQEPSRNLFGIKADERWNGDKVEITTTEYRDGLPLKEKADFRAYPDYASSFEDYASFLNENPRYQKVLQQADDPQAFAQALQDAGYATDPGYADKIQNIMERPTLGAVIDDGTEGE